MCTHLCEEICSVPLQVIESRSPGLYAPYPVFVNGITRKHDVPISYREADGFEGHAADFPLPFTTAQNDWIVNSSGPFPFACMSLGCNWPFHHYCQSANRGWIQNIVEHSFRLSFLHRFVCSLVRIGWVGISSSSCNAFVASAAKNYTNYERRYIYIYIYIYMCVCVCVCVCFI